MALILPQLTPFIFGVPVATLLIAISVIYRKKVEKILECYRQELSDTVKNRQLLFVRDSLGFMVNSHAEETIEFLLETPDPHDLTTNQMDELEQSLIQRFVRIKEEVTNLAEQAERINEPLILFNRTRKITLNTSRFFLGSGFVTGLLLVISQYLPWVAMPWYYTILLGLILMMIFRYRSSARAVESFRRKLNLWKEEPLINLGLNQVAIPERLVEVLSPYYV